MQKTRIRGLLLNRGFLAGNSCDAKAGYFWVFSLLLFGKGRMGSLKPLQNPQPMERRLADVANR